MDSTTSSNAASGRGLCVKGCGFYGSEETKNMCSKCYNHFLKTQIIDKTVKELESLSLAHTKPPNPSLSSSHHALPEQDSGSNTLNATWSGSDSGSRWKSRCKNCNKKVGLTGFTCRCGDLFCGKHRYATEHSCPFDYKKFDREILIKENQLIKGDKLAQRI
ncbi:hypothetical protein Ddye_013504 [Dipteronia dyeriana]|uniref:Uncharacterized protein n=1 Tax=Dipteronia dyeriana TaxID=168575 RepID=A0AAD9X6I4_9ROSI|nr:hypothetical protein Ddye_013502 [Dipteronia dyeriana]KAK2653648.1 hypothetical protein Ddye_013504 [Dipteronia dyeriana]